MHHCGDKKWTSREFENNFPFQLSFSSPIFMKGCFYCWGGLDALGFTIQQQVLLNVPCEAYNCTLVESFGKLLAAFIDFFSKANRVFQVRYGIKALETNKRIGKQDILLWSRGIFCVTAAAESMRNMIYFPIFHREFSFDLCGLFCSGCK